MKVNDNCFISRNSNFNREAEWLVKKLPKTFH